MSRALLALPLAVLLAGCQLPLTPEDLAARKFEAVAGKAVIYVVRVNPDFNDQETQIRVGDKLILKIYPGTYYRWVAEPGTHQIRGFAGDSGAITVQVGAGRIYFVKQQMTPFTRMRMSQFFLVNEAEGRAEVLRAVLLVPDP